ncbi:18158_t:CDS:2 [Entrophospora sp. SA101]|nr:18158_t:CDS:2 [Entrophospora sp. SA101]
MLPYGERNNSRKHVCMYYRYFNRPTSKEINEYFGKYDYEKRKDYQNDSDDDVGDCDVTTVFEVKILILAILMAVVTIERSNPKIKKYFVLHIHSEFRMNEINFYYVNGKKSEVFSNSSAAITNTYQELFSSKSKFSGPLIMGHNKSKINEQILADITFYPFNCMFSNIKLFVYGIGAFTKDHLDNTGPGFKSSFVYLIGAKKIKTLFVQEINEKNSSVKMYQNYNLVFTYIGNSPNNVWEKVGILSQHKGIDLFGITSPQVQSYIQKFRVPKCLPEEWIIEEKMKPLWEYHLRRFTLASTPWNEFFTKWYHETKTIIEITAALKAIYPSTHSFNEREMRAWRTMLTHAGCTNITPFNKGASPHEFWTKSSNPEADCNNLQFLYDSAFLKPIPKQYCSDVSEPTKPKSPWKIPLPHASGICPKRLALPELKNELTNRGIVYDNQNKRQKLIEMLDKELSQETLANVEEMLDVLKSKVEEGEIENSDLPKLPTIQGWITRYSAQLREKNAKTTLGVSN